MIEQAEYVLRDLGFYDVRVRHHELSSGFRVASPESATVTSPQPVAGNSQLATRNSELATVRHLARIEVGPTEMMKFLQDDAADRVAVALKKIGYAHVTLDLQGYRRAGVNETVPNVDK